jgi:dynein heavy chain
MSPVGDALRLRCRKFPSLVNCCTLDWFASWPKTALYEVAKKHLEGIQVPEQCREPLAQMCMEVSVSVSETCIKFFNEQKRKVYTTPKSYLDQL